MWSWVGKTHYEAWHWRKPFLKYLRVFRCLVFVHLRNDKPTKLDYTDTPGIFVQYSISSKQYFLYDPLSHTFHRSSDVVFREETSAKCISVRKPLANLPHTPVDLTSASMYFQMLPGHSGALQSDLRLCKSILRCSWKHLQLWRCIQYAMRLDYEDSQIWSSRDLCAAPRETWWCILTAVVLR